MFRILHVGPNLSSFLYCQDPCGIFPWTSMQNLNSSPPFLCIALKSWTLVNFPPELLFPLRYSLQVVRDSIWELYSGSTARKHEKLFKTGPLLKSFDDWVRSGAALRSALTAALVYLFCNGVLPAEEDEAKTPSSPKICVIRATGGAKNDSLIWEDLPGCKFE